MCEATEHPLFQRMSSNKIYKISAYIFITTLLIILSSSLLIIKHNYTLFISLNYSLLVIIIGYCINTTFYGNNGFRDMTMLYLKCCIYTKTLLLYTRIKLTRIMLIREINSCNYIYIRKMNQNSNEPPPYLTRCDHCSFVVA